MGISMQMKEELKDRRNVILDLIKESDKAITANELAALCGASYKTIWNDIEALKKSHPELKAIRGLGYIWEDSMEEKPKKSDLTNSEGYSDPTAGLAMRMMTPKEDKIGPGEVWEFQKNSYVPDNTKNLFLTLVVYPEIDLSLGLEVFKSNIKPAPNSGYVCYFERGNETYYVDARRIISKPAKYLTEYIGKLTDKTFLDIRKAAVSGFNVSVRIAEPSKEVKKEPAVKVSEPIDYQLQKQRADIYEKAFYALVGAKKGE